MEFSLSFGGSCSSSLLGGVPSSIAGHDGWTSLVGVTDLDRLTGVLSLDLAGNGSGALGVGVAGCDTPTSSGTNGRAPPVPVPGSCCPDMPRSSLSIVNGCCMCDEAAFTDAEGASGF